jgi:hypothetical protein
MWSAIMGKEVEKVQTCVVEVHSLPYKGVSRLTEAACEPLQNGARVQLPIDAARAVCERDPDHHRIIGASAAGIEKEAVKPEDVGFRYRLLTPKADPTATEKASGAAAEGKPANRSMAGKGEVKL